MQASRKARHKALLDHALALSEALNKDNPATVQAAVRSLLHGTEADIRINDRVLGRSGNELDELQGLEKEREMSLLLLDGRVKGVIGELDADLEAFKRETTARLRRAVEETFHQKERVAGPVTVVCRTLCWPSAMPMLLVWMEQIGEQAEADSLRMVIGHENPHGRVASAMMAREISRSRFSSSARAAAFSAFAAGQRRPAAKAAKPATDTR